MKNLRVLLLPLLLTACSAALPERSDFSSLKVSTDGQTTTAYMDAQENELKRIASEAPFKLTRQNNILTVSLCGKSAFSSGSILFPSTEETLEKIAGILFKYDKTHISVIGYADEKSFGGRLSEQQAKAVADVLKKARISDARFWIEGRDTDGENHTDIVLTPTFIK